MSRTPKNIYTELRARWKKKTSLRTSGCADEKHCSRDRYYVITVTLFSLGLLYKKLTMKKENYEENTDLVLFIGTCADGCLCFQRKSCTHTYGQNFALIINFYKSSYCTVHKQCVIYYGKCHPVLTCSSPSLSENCKNYGQQVTLRTRPCHPNI